jgi:glycosyltransferase A (GT-A) superfamily protein (DUF2064 family)
LVQQGQNRGPLGASLCPYFAVAEQEALNAPVWQGFDRILQGGGGLGRRQARIYDALLQRHGAAILVGGDMPHLRPDTLHNALGMLSSRSSDFVLGPAADGGYYLVGGSKPIDHALWEGVAYSIDDTFNQISEQLRSAGSLNLLPIDFDIDTPEDHARFVMEFPQLLAEVPSLHRFFGSI